MLKRRSLLAAAAATPVLMETIMSEAAAADPANTLTMQLKYGPVTMVLRPDLAPKACQQVKTLTTQGFYDGCKFFRVIPGFCAQTGDRSNTGTQGSSLPDLPAEFTEAASFLTGTIGMARTSDPNSANSQFFICLGPATFLDGQYTFIGKVTAGMDAVQQIKPGVGQSGSVTDPDVIIEDDAGGIGLAGLRRAGRCPAPAGAGRPQTPIRRVRAGPLVGRARCSAAWHHRSQHRSAAGINPGHRLAARAAKHELKRVGSGASRPRPPEALPAS